MSDIVDLDVIRPQAKYIKLSEKKIDVSFIPCGITFDIDQLMHKISNLDIEKVQAGGDAAREAFDMTVDMCVMFCVHTNPEMNREWFMTNVDAIQIQLFAEAIKDTLTKSYEAVSSYGDKSAKN